MFNNLINVYTSYGLPGPYLGPYIGGSKLEIKLGKRMSYPI